MLVYPPLNHKTHSNSIFFIGSAQKCCFINGQEIELIYAGNFCPVFPLKEGRNIFKIEIDGEILERVILCHPDEKPKDLHEPNKSFKVSNPSPMLGMMEQTDGVSRRICLDPGHGGSQRGTCSPKGITEKELNLSLAKRIRDQLINNNLEVKLTREADIDISLQARVDIAKEFKADLFISIHHNAIPDEKNPIEHHGLSVHYYYSAYKNLAKQYSVNFSDLLTLKNIGAIQQDLYVLRENNFCPALLIEFGYLIHPEESEIISKSDFQLKVANNFKNCIYDSCA